ncbi:MAG TPA: hypothetical protein VNB49_02155 [Candidatus Dormibacteraeota bacterium]|nr:hypothetical protein [Candidatus Dormibacteraeota bacterium]
MDRNATNPLIAKHSVIRLNLMNLHGEDTDVDPKRAAFIRKIVDKWEHEWLQEQAVRGQK